MVERLLVKYLRSKGWFVEQPEDMKFQETVRADALGRLYNYDWFGRFDPYSTVDVVTIERKEK